MPVGHTDVGGGAAVRVPFGQIKQMAALTQYAKTAQGGGANGVVTAQHGLSKNIDVGLMVAGSALRLSGRYEFLRWEDPSLAGVYGFRIGAAPFGGMLRADDIAGARAGLDVPLLFGAQWGGMLDLWAGARGGFEHVLGEQAVVDATAIDFRLWAARIGGVTGIAVGFRRLYVMVELTAYYERWRATVEDQASNAAGLILQPAFAVKLRI